VRDITERKHAEREIKKLNLAIEQSPVSIVITDLDANILYANPTFCETTGYTLSEVVGSNAKILKSGKTPNEVYRGFKKNKSNTLKERLSLNF
jgi:PAS domain S-box-containing protein